MRSVEPILKKQDLKKQLTNKIFPSIKIRKQMILRNWISFEKSDINEIYNQTTQVENITNKIFII
jgi:hypothetical protein